MTISVGFKLNNERADADKRQMGLTMWAAAPEGKITSEIAKSKAETEFERYRVIQDRLFMSDFDKHIREVRKELRAVEK